jgi:hypothetical protein
MSEEIMSKHIIHKKEADIEEDPEKIGTSM